MARLSRSEYSDKFIFKGGLLLSYYVVICRETTDIDLLAKRLHTETFHNRGTAFSIPVQFQLDELDRMQALWSGHLRVLGVSRSAALSLPNNIATVIDELNHWLSFV